MQAFLDSPTFTWIILPLLIFCARIGDMSLDTMRIVMISRGRKFTAAGLGFFEICIWLLVARQVIVHLPNPLCFFAYAGGFAAGNYVGMWIEERMASGAQMIRVVNHRGVELMEALKKRGHGVTIISGEGAEGPVQIIFTVVPRKDARAVVELIQTVSPGSFYTIEDIREAGEGIFPRQRERGIFKFGKRE
ncbi:MAG: DUF2179 domain-containing protein [Desulfobulbaceae bacterium]|nr:DUF2179 domain-containing protein [Desulfobulbaceae bacterium]